jgi:elongator complex protein 1
LKFFFSDEAFIDEAQRRIERGAKIVHCVYDSTVCVLQMPRGNLEAISPRTLIIMKIKELIDL